MTEQENNLNQYLYFIGQITTGCTSWDFRDKQKSIDYKVTEMLIRLQSLTEYENLPDTIQKKDLELLLMTSGFGVGIEHEGNPYILFGSLGGVRNQNYEPTEAIVSNPFLNLSKTLTIGKDCVVIRNDSLRMGVLPILTKYATLMTENELSLWIASTMTRLFSIIVADDDKKLAAANRFIKGIEGGNLAAILSETSPKDKALGTQSNGIGIETQPYGNAGSTNAIQNLIELQQYLKASQYNDLGLNANYNMKRESLNSTESQLNDDALMPFIDDMIKNREEGLDQFNKMFGTNIKVKKSSAWMDNQIENDLTHEEEEGKEEEKKDTITDEEEEKEMDKEEKEKEEEEEEKA